MYEISLMKMVVVVKIRVYFRVLVEVLIFEKIELDTIDFIKLIIIQ